MMSETWQEALDKFQLQIIPPLGKYGKEIGRKANEGDKLSQEIINVYGSLYKQFDPVLDLYLRDKMNEWIKQNVSIL